MSDKIRDALVEAVAEAIYVQWSTQAGYVPWVARGNSLKQGEARRIARSAIENGFPLAQQPAPAAPVAVGQEPVGKVCREAPGCINWAVSPYTMAAGAALYAAPPAAEQPDTWTPSGADYDRNIHSNPDAKAWADFFVTTFPGLADKHDLMLGWFANAMMAMHDFLKSEQPDTVVVPRELADRLCHRDNYTRQMARRELRNMLLVGGDKP